MSWDNQILLFMAAHRSEGLDAGFRAVTWLGSLYVLAPLAVLLVAALLYFHKRWEALLLVVGLGGAVLWVHLAKAILARPRPALVEPVIALPTDGFRSPTDMQRVMTNGMVDGETGSTRPMPTLENAPANAPAQPAAGSLPVAVPAQSNATGRRNDRNGNSAAPGFSFGQ